MILLALIVHLVQDSIQAAPTVAHSNVVEVVLGDLSTCPGLRSIWDIIWSCLVTIFACSWLSIHPNIPNREEGFLKLALRRLELMAWSIVAPEFIIMWAMRQWRGARILEGQYRDRGWTKMHCHFLQMGGFMLHDPETDQALRVLSPREFERLLNEGRIQIPKISESDIQDRSKADGLSKAVVVVQTIWFVVQCIARRAQGLVTTEFELVTVSFAALNGVMYYLWWDKPLDVHSTVAVYLLDPPELEKGDAASENLGEARSISNDSGESGIEIAIVQETPIQELEKAQVSSITPNEGDPSTTSSEAPMHASRNGSGWKFKRSILLLRNIVLKVPILIISSIYRRLHEMSVFADESSITDQTCLPSFYALSDLSEARSGWPEMNIVTAAAAFGALFGAIHCIGWSFIFPSKSEEKLWRICSALITAIPVIALFIHPLGFVLTYLEVTLGIQDDSKMYDMMAMLVGIPMLLVLLPLPPIYVIARLTLLVEAAIALRDVPSGAYAQVVWTSFLPHI